MHMHKRNKRKTSKRPKQRRTPFSVRIGILITAVVLSAAAVFALTSPVLTVNEVYCEGTVNLKYEDIINISQIQCGKNIFMTHIGKAKRSISKLSMVKNVNIQRIFPNKICISVEERVPVAYISVNDKVFAIDSEKIVIKSEDDNTSSIIINENTPHFKDEASSENSTANADDNNGGDSSESSLNDSDEEDIDDTASEAQKNQPDTASDTEGTSPNTIKIPLIFGIEASSAEEGKKIKCTDDAKLDTAIDICVALQHSDLLQKSTYLDISDISDIRLVIENRLDIKLGTADNIDYRAEFMAEVINNKISAYETAVLDYTGTDIYVRPRDDGKQRVAERKKTSSDSDDEEDSDSGDGNSHKSTDSDDDDLTDDENEDSTSSSSHSGGSVKSIDDSE